MMFLSAGIYIFNNAFVTNAFIRLGFPTYLIYPIAFVKVAGIATILFGKNKIIREWTYAGFFYLFLLALIAHIIVADGQFGGALVALLSVTISYFTRKKLAKNN